MENKIIDTELENVTGGAGINNTHIMRAGETLYSIAAQYHTTVAMLMYLNPQIKHSDWICIGASIRIR